MQRHRFYCNPLQSGTNNLTGTEAHHLSHVLRLKTGENVELFDGSGGLATAAITGIKHNEVFLQTTHLERFEAIKKERIIIASSIAKGDKFDWLITKCTELGADCIWPVLFERTVKQPKESACSERFFKLAVAASKQSERLFLPNIEPPRPLEQVINFAKTTYPKAIKFFGSPEPNAKSAVEIDFTDSDIIVFIGPEGGITETETNLLLKFDVVPVKLTRTILRIETAAVAFTAVFAAKRDSKK